MRRVESVEAFATLQPDDWPNVAVDACRLAIAGSGINDQPALDALRAVGVEADRAALGRADAQRRQASLTDAPPQR